MLSLMRCGYPRRGAGTFSISNVRAASERLFDLRTLVRWNRSVRHSEGSMWQWIVWFVWFFAVNPAGWRGELLTLPILPGMTGEFLGLFEICRTWQRCFLRGGIRGRGVRGGRERSGADPMTECNARRGESETRDFPCFSGQREVQKRSAELAIELPFWALLNCAFA